MKKKIVYLFALLSSSRLYADLASDVSSMFSTVEADLTSVLTAVVPVVIPVGILILAITIAWQLISLFTGNGGMAANEDLESLSDWKQDDPDSYYEAYPDDED